MFSSSAMIGARRVVTQSNLFLFHRVCLASTQYSSIHPEDRLKEARKKAKEAAKAKMEEMEQKQGQKTADEVREQALAIVHAKRGEQKRRSQKVVRQRDKT